MGAKAKSYTIEKSTWKGKGLMEVISVSTIGNLISAHMEGDNEKFLIFANFIADAYEEAGEGRCARIIRKRIDGTYKDDSTVTLDSLIPTGKPVGLLDNP